MVKGKPASTEPDEYGPLQPSRISQFALTMIGDPRRLEELYGLADAMVTSLLSRSTLDTFDIGWWCGIRSAACALIFERRCRRDMADQRRRLKAKGSHQRKRSGLK